MPSCPSALGATLLAASPPGLAPPQNWQILIISSKCKSEKAVCVLKCDHNSNWKPTRIIWCSLEKSWQAAQERFSRGPIRRGKQKLLVFTHPAMLVQGTLLKGALQNGYSIWILQIAGKYFLTECPYLHHYIAPMCRSCLSLQEFSLNFAPFWADGDPEYTRHSRICLEITTKEHLSRSPLANTALGSEDGKRLRIHKQKQLFIPLTNQAPLEIEGSSIFQKLCFWKNMTWVSFESLRSGFLSTQTLLIKARAGFTGKQTRRPPWLSALLLSNSNFVSNATDQLTTMKGITHANIATAHTASILLMPSPWKIYGVTRKD